MKLSEVCKLLLITITLTGCLEENKKNDKVVVTPEVEYKIKDNKNLESADEDIYLKSNDYNNADEDLKMDLKNNDLESNVSINVLDVVNSSKDFSTLIKAAKTIGLENLLNADDNFTVFAPTNSAFDRLPNNTLNSLLKPENKQTLEKILRYHVYMGNLKADLLIKNIKTNNNNFIITSALGEKFSASLEGDFVILKDAKGNKSRIIKADTNAKNGVVHVINRVMSPRLP